LERGVRDLVSLRFGRQKILGNEGLASETALIDSRVAVDKQEKNEKFKASMKKKDLDQS